MISYKLTVGKETVEVSLDSGDQNLSAPIELKGKEEAVAPVREYLANTLGAYGHILNPESATPADLSVAMARIQVLPWKPQLVEGADLVEQIDPKIPEGSVS